MSAATPYPAEPTAWRAWIASGVSVGRSRRKVAIVGSAMLIRPGSRMVGLGALHLDTLTDGDRLDNDELNPVVYAGR